MLFNLRVPTRVAALASALWVAFALIALPTGLRADTLKGRNIEQHLTFGFLPIVSTKRLIKRFEPLADYLSKEMGVPVRLETAPDFATFHRRAINEKRYDFLYTAPHLYYLAQRQAGYKVSVRVDADELYAVIVVRKDSPIKSISGLCGKKLTTPDRLALMTALIRKTIDDIGCKKGNEVVMLPTPTHNAALLNTYNRTSDAAGLERTIFGRTKPEVRNYMRIIGRTGGTPHMPISIAPWVDKKTAAKFTRILLSLKETEKGRALLSKLNWPGFTSATPQEYDVMEPYAKFIKY